MCKSVNKIKPAFEDNNIVIILSSSNEFVPYLGVCIESIIENSNDENNYDLIIMERGISKANKRKILTLNENKNNIIIRFFDVRSEIKNINFYINSNRISQETYYGLIVPYLLVDFKKAIIMDCDMIVKKDLSILYNTDLENNIAAGVNDVILLGWLNDKNNDTLDYYQKSLEIENPFNCINGGLLLLDLEKYRKSISKALVIDYLNNYQLRVVDQDIFNKILYNNIKHLDVRWNHMIYINGAISDAIEHAPQIAKSHYFEAKKDPFIIHYASENKPWINPELEFADDFWLTARRTCFYEIILLRLIKTVVADTSQHVSHVPIIENGSYLKKIIKIFFPTGTKRNIILKKIYFKVIGSNFVRK